MWGFVCADLKNIWNFFFPILSKIVWTYSHGLQWPSFPIHPVLGCKKSSLPPIHGHICRNRKYFVKFLSLSNYTLTVKKLSHILGNLLWNWKKTSSVPKPPSHPNVPLGDTLLNVFHPNHLWTVPGNHPYQLLLWIASHMLLYERYNIIVAQ